MTSGAGFVGLAETCFIDKVTDSGAGSVWYVRLADGYLIECSTPQRAKFVCDAINATLPSTEQAQEKP